jgi:hypothetical protein
VPLWSSRKRSKKLCYNQGLITMKPALCNTLQFPRYSLRFGIVVLAAALAGCGGYNSNSTSNQVATSGIKKRVLISNQQAGSVTIMDAQADTLSTRSFTVFGASQMAANGGVTAVIGSTGNNVGLFDNVKEQAGPQPVLSSRVEDIAVSPDGKTVYAAVRNSGFVAFVSVADGSFSMVNVPSVHRLVLSPNGSKLLAFSDDPQNQSGANANAFSVIDTGTKAVTLIAESAGDQPFTGVFAGSDTRALILNCGAECGGTTASVVLVDFSGAVPVITPKVTVSGATVGVLSGPTLFVAGTPVGSPTGTVQAINTNTMTASAPVAITDGQHTKMRVGSNNRLYIGAVACTTSPGPTPGTTKGCLTIFNTSSSAVIIPAFGGLRSIFDVTGIQPISNRNVIYVCEGGELDIFDTTTDALTPTQIDVAGKAFDVLQIDP